MAMCYYFGFRFLIRKFDLKTPGREVINDSENQNDNFTDKEIAAMAINYLGGNKKITSIDYCITRLRVEVKDTSLVDVAGFKMYLL